MHFVMYCIFDFHNHPFAIYVNDSFSFQTVSLLRKLCWAGRRGWPFCDQLDFFLLAFFLVQFLEIPSFFNIYFIIPNLYSRDLLSNWFQSEDIILFFRCVCPRMICSEIHSSSHFRTLFLDSSLHFIELVGLGTPVGLELHSID